MTRVYLILTVIALTLIGATLTALYIYHAGARGQAATQAIAQVKHDQKVKRDYDKIDRQTPFGGNSAAVAAFLLSHTRSDQ